MNIYYLDPTCIVISLRCSNIYTILCYPEKNCSNAWIRRFPFFTSYVCFSTIMLQCNTQRNDIEINNYATQLTFLKTDEFHGELFPRYYLYSYKLSMFKLLNTHQCVTRRERVLDMCVINHKPLHWYDQVIKHLKSSKIQIY